MKPIYGVVFACALPLNTVLAQGVTLDELLSHVVKTNPEFQSLELSPKFAELSYKAATAEDWILSAQSSFERSRNQYAVESGRADISARNDIGIWRQFRSTGVNLNLSYDYNRYVVDYTEPSNPWADYKSYWTGASVSLSAPLWNNAFGYNLRRSLEQDEISLEKSRVRYQSNRESYLVDVNHRFVSLCGVSRRAELSGVVYKIAQQLLVDAAKRANGRDSQHAERFERETAANLSGAQSAFESARVAMATYFNYPRLQSEPVRCDARKLDAYVTSKADVNALIDSTRTMRSLALDERALQLSKEIAQNNVNPSLNVMVRYRVNGYDNHEYEASFDRDGSLYEISLNLWHPLGNTRGHVAIDRADLNEIVFNNEVDDAALRLEQSIRSLTVLLREGEQLIVTQTQRAEKARQTRENDMRAYLDGRLDVALLEDSLRNELDAELALANSQETYQHVYLDYLDVTDRYPDKISK